jgi:single-stranded-DNA-specific exonuclease
MDTRGQNVEREWVLRQAPDADWRHLSDELQVSPVTAQILWNRGLRDADVAGRFLDPKLAHMHDPFTMKDMMNAVGEVLKAIERGQRITIHGDYDVDGVSSVSVLYGFLRDIGADVNFYIPTRDSDGYGLNVESVRRFHSEGTGLLITTDCGISNVEEIRLANELGMRCIVVDHHSIPPELPPARAILNPLQEDCEFPFEHLAAVGVTFNFVVAIRAELRKRGVFDVVPEPDLRPYLDLVALGTIADVMPLVDENRIFARLGLEVLARRRRAGISALMDRASVDVGPVDARTVSYRLAPRLNAAGRMGDASICVELLTTRDYGRATKLATQLEELNTARQDEERGILELALEQAKTQAEREHHVLVVAGEEWHRGVLGIVASRLMELFHRPAILMGIEHGVARGSARSIEGINLLDALRRVDELLSTYGGHSLAAGLSLKATRLDTFTERLQEAVETQIGTGSMPRPTLTLDGTIDFASIDATLVEEFERLGPFGSGNPEPVLLATQAVASSVRTVGDKHLRARFRDSSGMIDAFGFSMSESKPILDDPVAVAFVPRQFRGRGKPRLEIQLRDLRPAGRPAPDRTVTVED